MSAKPLASGKLVEQYRLVMNQMLLDRTRLLAQQTDGPGRDIDGECGYVKNPTIKDYYEWYRSEGPATTAVNVYPDECWHTFPEVYQTESPRKTRWEARVRDVFERTNAMPFLHRVDRSSGIGQFGVLLLGIDDRKRLDQPVDPETPHDLLYLRSFDQTLVKIKSLDKDETSPRYGEPEFYELQLGLPETGYGEDTAVEETDRKGTTVHWHRVLHVCQGRVSSEIVGTPILKNIHRRVQDIKKILGADGEAMWRNAIPVLNFESLPDAVDGELDEDSIKEMMIRLSLGQQKYIATEGLKASLLTSNMVDPTAHVAVHVAGICMTIRVPMRIFMGSEAGHLASDQDDLTWKGRLRQRQCQYIDPFLLRPFVIRLMDLNVLPKVKRFKTDWTDLNLLTDKDRADVGLKTTQAMLQYVTSGSFKFVRPKQYLTYTLRYSDEVADAILEASGGEAGVLKSLEELVSMKAATNTPAGTGTNPSDSTGSSGRRNAQTSANGNRRRNTSGGGG